MPPQVGAPQVGAPQVGVRQVGARQVGVRQGGAPQVGARQVGALQVGARQVGVRQVGVRQVGGPQVGARQVGPNERTVLFCSISGQTMNLRGETDGLQGQPERPKSVRVFRHLFPADPDIVTGEIDMLPAKRGQMGQQMLGDTFGLA